MKNHKIKWFSKLPSNPSKLKKLVEEHGVNLMCDIVDVGGSKANRALKILLENGLNPLKTKRVIGTISGSRNVSPIVWAVNCQNLAAFRIM